MQTSIRRATVGDTAEIARVHVDTWRTGYAGIVPQAYLDSLNPAHSAAMWQEQLGTGEAVILVAEADDQLGGFVAGGPIRGVIGSSDAEIYAVYVVANCQRRGVARALMTAMGEALRAKGLLRPALWVLAENAACGFYAHLGGKPAGKKEIEIGGKGLVEVAYAWDSVDELLAKGKP